MTGSPDLFEENSEEVFLFLNDYYEEITFGNGIKPGSRINEIEFYKCIFKNSIFNNSNFYNCRFEDCKFENCDLSLSTFKGSSFTGVKFKNSKLVGIDWRTTAKPFNVSYSNCLLNDSIFFNLDLRSTEFISCQIYNSDFERANLSHSKCNSSDFSGSRFNGTNLSFADFRDAKNYNIDPTQNNINKAKFSLPDVIHLLNKWEITID